MDSNTTSEVQVEPDLRQMVVYFRVDYSVDC